ncbi:MAG TPA: PorP/SprF family type IX secretion system membrane protein, partial [Chitinophagales bacterium]|nr:PorP/SprF family type IX secretion system membrane protein [Chitinophagales bacterium]
MVKRLLFFAALLVASSAGAQDLHFTQYHMSPLTLNPAFTGVFNGNMRLTANYRNQWQSILPTVPFRTLAGAAELSGRSGQDNRIGAGLHVFTDKAGSLDLSKTQVSGSLAYTMALSRNRDYYLAAGFQANFNQASFDYLKITTGSQFIEGTHDELAPTGESFSYGNHSYVDAGLGILWYHIASVRSYQYIGGSAFHVNRPNISFLDNSVDKLYAKYVVHAGAGFKVGARTDIVPHLLAMKQGPSLEVNGGGFMKF